ncbi:MAG: DUF4350 domain-containing protein [Clostridium sp.]
MKKKNNKDLMLFILIVPVFLFLAFYILPRMDKKIPHYSVTNISKMGYSVFYESLKKLNYPVERTLKKVSEFKPESIQIISPGGEFDINNPEVMKWVEEGGILVYLTPEINPLIKYGTSVGTKDNIKLYTYHKGSIINADADFITNKALMKDTSKAYELLKEISNLPYKKLYFNESYMFPSDITKSLWEVTPKEIKYIIYQILIALAALFYYKGKRFGKIIPLYEEVEREENEYLYSAASLYMEAKCLDLMINIYYQNFLKGFKGNSEDWLEYWKIEEMPSLHEARRVYEFMNNKKSKPKAKEYIKIITIIEYLNNIVDKRRDLHWKILKNNSHVNL